jgi:hypothetical protein
MKAEKMRSANAYRVVPAHYVGDCVAQECLTLAYLHSRLRTLIPGRKLLFLSSLGVFSVGLQRPSL